MKISSNELLVFNKFATQIKNHERTKVSGKNRFREKN
jgi:hypothetical protein